MSARSPNQNQNDETFLTVDEVAGQLRVSTQTVRRWIKHGELPGYRVGRRFRIRRADLVEWIERHRLAQPVSG